MMKLTTQQMQDLNHAERILHDLLPDIDKMEACGDDCQNLRKENERIRKKISDYKQHFGQDVPSV